MPGRRSTGRLRGRAEMTNPSSRCSIAPVNLATGVRKSTGALLGSSGSRTALWYLSASIGSAPKPSKPPGCLSRALDEKQLLRMESSSPSRNTGWATSQERRHEIRDARQRRDHRRVPCQRRARRRQGHRRRQELRDEEEEEEEEEEEDSVT